MENPNPNYLETVLLSVVSEVQLGFFKGWHSFSSFQSLFNIIHSKQTCKNLASLWIQRMYLTEFNGDIYSQY